MEQPREFENENLTVTVRRLSRSIYGQKQAHRRRHIKIRSHFVDFLNFEASPVNDCVFTCWQNGQCVIIALYVDDLLIAYSSENISL